jgi:flavin-dependent dehydrogenase
MSDKTAIVVGAGILGMATARALALKGYKVTIMEKSVPLRPSANENMIPQVIPNGKPFINKHIIFNGVGSNGKSKSGSKEPITNIKINLLLPTDFNSEIYFTPKNLLAVYPNTCAITSIFLKSIPKKLGILT